MSNVIKINHAEFGIAETKAKQIEEQFKPMLEKMTDLETEFNKIAKMKMSDKTSLAAKTLRLKYVKVRTGTAEIHQQQKKFYLAAGRFVDGWKNAQLFASEGIEKKLSAIENHAAIKEAERMRKLVDKRLEFISKFTEEPASNLGQMPMEVWEHYSKGVKASFDARIEAERVAEEERAERLRLDAVEHERKEKIGSLTFFASDGMLDNIRTMTVDEFNSVFEALKQTEKEYEADQLQMKADNERLAKEKEIADKQAETLRKKNQKIADELAEKNRIESERIANAKRLESDRIAKEKADAEKLAQRGDKGVFEQLRKDVAAIEIVGTVKSEKAKVSREYVVNSIQELIAEIESYINEL
jgi:hypothetical protein